MNKFFLSLSVFGVAALARAQAPGQAPAPAVAPAAERPRVTLDEEPAPTPEPIVEREPDGLYVAYTNFLKLMREADPASRSEWDSITGVLTVQTQGRTLRALANRPFLLVDGRSQTVGRTLRVKNGVVLMPVDTARAMLEVIAPGRPVALPAESPTPAPAETAMPKAEPSPPPSRAAKSTPAPAPETPKEEKSDSLLSGDSLLSSDRAYAPPSVEAPPELDGQPPLSWDRVADRAHRLAPSRGAIVCDSELAPFAQRVAQLVADSLSADVEVVVADLGRVSPGPLSRLSTIHPEFVVDLLAAKDGEGPGAQAGMIEVWAAHEALWPGDASSDASGDRPPSRAYRKHQLQNLALGSMLRQQLGRNFPKGSVSFSLSPSYLLRRVDAPAAAILAPASIALNGEDGGRLARAIAGGVSAYFKGIESAAARAAGR